MRTGILVGLLSGFLCISTLLSFTACGDAAPTENNAGSAEVTNHKASLRLDPTTVASEIAFLDRGLEIDVIGRTAEKVRISGLNEYWFRIRTPDGIEGWIYGASLSIGSSGGIKRKAKQDRKEVVLSLVGKWWETKPDGSTGYRRFYVWADGMYKYAYGTEGPMKEGKYTLDLEKNELKLDPPAGMGDTVRLKRVGTELRLFADTDGKTVAFRRAFLDPDAPDPLDEAEEGEGGETPAADGG